MALNVVGEKALISAKDSKTVITKEPTPKKVKDEETYVEEVEKIIVRDFFPDLPQMRAQQEYLTALEKNDTEKLRLLHIKYGPKRGTTKTPSIYDTPATFETPETRRIGSPSKEKDSTEANKESDHPQSEKKSTKKLMKQHQHGRVTRSSTFSHLLLEHSVLEKKAGKFYGERAFMIYAPKVWNTLPSEIRAAAKNPTDVTLDKYLARNTSEDNAAFAEILEENKKKQRAKHEWLYEAENKQHKEMEANLALPGVEGQMAIEAAPPKELQTWNYEARNKLMYVPEGAPESLAEKLERKQPREIMHHNTRFKLNPFNNDKSKQAIQHAASMQAFAKQGKIGPDGKEVLPVESPRVNGYGFMATPSPKPGVDESPLMTWGEIEGTPFRLDGSDTPYQKSAGPSFKIPDIPNRDRIALELAEKASKAHRSKKEETLKRMTANFASPSLRTGSVTDRINTMSPAAQRLASAKLGIRTHTDKALRASYTPSPSHRLPGDKTPLSITPNRTPKTGGTPKVGASPQTPKSTPKRDSNAASLTDNLLNLPKRPRASEFF